MGEKLKFGAAVMRWTLFPRLVFQRSLQARFVNITHGTLPVRLNPVGMLIPEIVVDLMLQLHVRTNLSPWEIDIR